MRSERCRCCGKKATVSGFCKKHYLINWRNIHRIRYLWQALKDNSKRRGKFNDLTPDEFEAFCVLTGYDKNVGTTANSFSIDRIINEIGYTYSNIRSIKLCENSSKSDKSYYSIDREDDNLPF